MIDAARRAGQPSDHLELNGIPVIDQRVLSASDPELVKCLSIDDHAALARRLRGPFSIIRSTGPQTTIAVTDYCGSFPVYFALDSATGTYRVSSTLSDLRSCVSGEISEDALLWYATHGGTGATPLYEGVRMVPPGMAMQFDGAGTATLTYIDWEAFLSETPYTDDDARDRFLEISDGYLRPIGRAFGQVGCLLSGGTDSAIVALLLKRACPEVICYTSDYAVRRYSEWALAKESARRLGLAQRRVIVGREDNHRAFLEMNGRPFNFPSAHSQLTSTVANCNRALHDGTKCLFSGHNSGPIFLEFEKYFAGFPQTTQGYLGASAALTAEEKLARVLAAPELRRSTPSLLRALGTSASRYPAWAERIIAAERSAIQAFAGPAPLHALYQVAGQIGSGILYQNVWLPAAQGARTGMQLLSPFTDIEMIRFAMSLPLRLKFRDGVTRFFLRDFLRRELGLWLPKVYSPNPSRIWWLVPHLADLRRIDARLKPLLAASMATNIFSIGRHYYDIQSATALGIWLRDHELGAVRHGIPDSAGMQI